MTSGAPFARLAETSQRLAATRSRTEKRTIAGELLAALAPDEIAPAVGWLVAEPICGPVGVGWAQLGELSRSPPASEPSVSLREVEDALASSADRAEVAARVDALYTRFTEAERRLFAGALTGNLRQGSLGGVMILALADRAGLPEAVVRRAVMVSGSITRAAAALLGPERRESPPSSLELFQPIAPMLAGSAKDLHAALEEIDEPAARAVEWKLDGVRAQVHKLGDRVAVYSRSGHDVTEGCHPLLGALSTLGAARAVLDGEVVLEDATGAMRSFQDTFSAVAGGAVPEGDRLRIYLFDCVHADGVDLLDRPLSERIAALERMAPEELRVPRCSGADLEEARRFQAEAIAFGHEGVMVKDLRAPYRLGARGRAWQKVKEHSTVDLVILAVERGSGRRTGLLSNLHLGARRPDGTFCMVGKTFKGLTDKMLHFQTKRLGELAIAPPGPDDWVVHVRPELVVEIRFDDVQRSSRYPGGIALRFARVVRYRTDKRPEDVEPLGDLQALAPEPRPEGSARKSSAGAKREAKEAAKRKQLSLFDD